MKKSYARLIMTLTIGLFSILYAAAENELVQGFGLKSQVKGDHVLQFNIPDYELEDVTLHGQTFKRPVIDGAGQSSLEGNPELPVLTTFYTVEPGKSYRVQVNIISSETIENVDLLPWQTWENVTLDEVVNFKRNINTYTAPAPYPEKLAIVSEPQTFRNLELVTVSFTPFQYQPLEQKLEIITSAEIELVETGSIADNAHRPAKRSRVFEKLYESIIINYERFMSDEDFQKPSILYILPNNSSNLMSTLNQLFNWRHKSGFVVNFASTNTTGSSASAIKNYIQNAYQSWNDPPEYVALVGDASGSYSIPTYYDNWSSYNGEGDFPYSQLEGNDLFPEVLIGRISFSSTTDLATIINKTIQYETNPYMGENWFTRACMVGDPSSSGISCVITKEVARHYIEEMGGYNDVRTVYNGSFPNQMVNNLNDGLTFFNYRGYYNTSGFNTGHISGLSNGFKLCVATVITCGTGSFASGTSMSEAFIRVGTPSQPKGGVAAIGTATLGTHTMFNNAVDMGFYYGVFVDGLETPSAALVRGTLHLYQTYPSNPNNFVSIFTHWNNLMGDPALRMWTAVPQNFIVTYDNSINRGTNFIDIHVTDSDGIDMQGAYVTILKGSDEVFESGYTDAAGNITLPINSFAVGNMFVTVTAKNYIPHQGTVQITNPETNVNILSSLVVVDDDGNAPSNGNGDNILNSSEVVELTIPIHNYGTSTIANVIGTLIAHSSNVNVNFGTITYGGLDSNETLIPTVPYVIELENSVIEGQNVELRLILTDEDNNSWEGMLTYNAAGSYLDVVSVNVIDGGGGDGVLDPGETAELQFVLSNSGSVNATNVMASLNTNLPALEITDENSVWGTIIAGQMTSSVDHFIVTADENLIPGTMAHLFLTITGGDGFEILQPFTLQIGTVSVTDPLGPDEYGYYIYDSGDQIYSNAPFYNWIEIDSRYGGTGTYLPVYDSGDNGDDVYTLPLPFSFRMYGQVYGQITICSNGWIAMGDTDMQSFRNYPIPGPGGPSPMIAGFWDDLTTQSQGRVYKYYDEDSHQFIVQWSRMRTYDNNSPETFQIILKDPAYYFTPTGDGEILIQYQTFNNTSTGSYGWGQVHGAYCTIGIEDVTATKGLQYTFNNQYPTAAMPLDDETAILITTRGSDMRMRGDVNQDGELNVSDVLILVDYIINQETSNLNPYLADMNQDEIINILDMIGIILIIMDY